MWGQILSRVDHSWGVKGALILPSKLMSANEDRLQTACIYAKFVRVTTFHKFNSTANSADMQENNDPSRLLLSQVYLLV